MVGTTEGHRSSSMRLNRHDTWQRFTETYQELLVETGLPKTIVRSEQRFRELLATGQVTHSQSRVSLAELMPTEWSALYSFVAVFFREFESFAPEDLFPVFRDEAQRRGDRFPR